MAPPKLVSAADVALPPDSARLRQRAILVPTETTPRASRMPRDRIFDRFENYVRPFRISNGKDYRYQNHQ